MTEKRIYFIGDEEFEYVIEKVGEQYVGKTFFDSRLNCTANSLNEVEEIVKNRISQLTFRK